MPPSCLPVLRVPVPFQISDERGAENTIGLVARIGGGVAAEEVERLLRDAKGAAIADGAGRACIGQAVNDACDRLVHPAGACDLVTDEPALGTVTHQFALILDQLTRKAIAGE